MLSEVCKYLNNWFDCERLYGTFVITDGTITTPNMSEKLQDGQYFRVIESVFNDGVHQWGDEDLFDETFEGAVWILKIPPRILDISDEIDAWQEKYLGTDSAALSPYQSESFGGYSYSKGSSADGSAIGGDWTKVTGFTSRLNEWRKPRCRY